METHLSVQPALPLSAFVKTTTVLVFASASVLNIHLSSGSSFFSDDSNTTAPRSILLDCKYLTTASPQLAWLLYPYPGVSTSTRLCFGGAVPLGTDALGILGSGPTPKAFMSVVRPGLWLTLAAEDDPTRALRNVDLPTLEAPRMMISGTLPLEKQHRTEQKHSKKFDCTIPVKAVKGHVITYNTFGLVPTPSQNDAFFIHDRNPIKLRLNSLIDVAMTVRFAELDAHEQPSAEMRAEWKYYSRLEPSVLAQEPSIDDPRKPLSENGFRRAGQIDKSQVASAFAELSPELSSLSERDVPIIHHPLLPGLLIVPDLVPPAIQKTLLSRMLHRDLSNPKHQTNMHLHYTLPCPATNDDTPPTPPSFFALPPESPTSFVPKDAAVHRPLTPRQVLTRRLHWVTLGGQYDWTKRVYPDQPEPPRFPLDLSQFLERLFPETLAQAAIVNFYSPGDTMMMHRDVSEETDKGLVSLSFGCDCLFMVAPSGPPPFREEQSGKGEQKRYLLLRLRSGDAIYMTQESRYAWHGVPKVIKGTCPEYLENWPSEDGKYTEWEGWMKNKRINLNVRQMRD
ncbi:hypothetical protein C2857_002479 [Epichloe festucae Fl1]|uniref:mRNA N(6)-methyladenine demethylase n=1 Tax=Epichloe festucae (strain Fl1) TaxID=877507 RepID=A0A7U3Q089_EPIFF|nr:hypothetical protein C2857_002479 [Epichloe festucae Fl1]